MLFLSLGISGPTKLQHSTSMPLHWTQRPCQGICNSWFILGDKSANLWPAARRSGAGPVDLWASCMAVTSCWKAVCCVQAAAAGLMSVAQH